MNTQDKINMYRRLLRRTKAELREARARGDKFSEADYIELVSRIEQQEIGRFREELLDDLRNDYETQRNSAAYWYDMLGASLTGFAGE